jgi:hypothetical protein
MVMMTTMVMMTMSVHGRRPTKKALGRGGVTDAWGGAVCKCTRQEQAARAGVVELRGCTLAPDPKGLPAAALAGTNWVPPPTRGRGSGGSGRTWRARGRRGRGRGGGGSGGTG